MLSRGRQSRSLALLIVALSILVLIATPSRAQLEDLIARVKPAVVLVTVKHVLGGSGHGSGFSYDTAGFILTNHHVVEGAVEITVTLSDRRTFPATVVDYLRKEQYADTELQSTTDAAVLKINASGLPTLPLGDSDSLRQGQELLVLGFPGGVGTGEVSATRGIVSAVRMGWIQTDAAIERGNSGGPVVDSVGRVIGLATFVTGSFKKIGGVTSVNSIRDMAIASLSPDTGRRREVSVTGAEYAPVGLGRRKLWRVTYDPGRTGGQPSVRETTSEVTRVENVVGALAYTLRDTDSGEYRYYHDSSGYYLLGRFGGPWSYSYPEPALILPFPPVVGRSWQWGYRAENVSEGMRSQGTLEVRIDSTNEVVSVPAGTFSRAMRVVQSDRWVLVRGGQPQHFNAAWTGWLAPGVGAVRVVGEILETRERFVRELTGHF